MESKTHTHGNLEFTRTLTHTKWRCAGNSSVVNPKLMLGEKHRWYLPEFTLLWAKSWLPFTCAAICTIPNVTTTNTTAANPRLLVPAYRTKNITQCWTEFCIKSRYSSPVFHFHFHQQGQQDLLAGEAKGEAAPKCAQGPISITPGAVSGELTPSCRVCVAAWAKHTGSGLSCYSGKLILCRYTQIRSSCNYFFGLLHSGHFTGTSVSSGPSRRKKCCFAGFFFKSPSLLLPDTYFCMRQGKKERESPACTA